MRTSSEASASARLSLATSGSVQVSPCLALSGITSTLPDPLGAEADLAFKSCARVVSIQIHKINANVSAIQKFVDLLGSQKDTPDLRKKLSVPASLSLSLRCRDKNREWRSGGAGLSSSPHTPPQA